MSTLANFLMEKIERHNIFNIFGVNGDYISDFYEKIKSSRIKPVFNSDESHSGFAANAYARVNGFGAVCVNYQTGAYKIVNSIACAHVERTPVMIISGSPGLKEKRSNKQFEIFKNITKSAYVLEDLSYAGYLIDKAFEELNYYKQPVYLEVPRDLFNKTIDYDVYRLGTYQMPKTNPNNLDEAVKEIKDKLNKSQSPVFVFGVEIARYGLGSELLRLMEETNIPFLTEVASKSVVSEQHMLFSGILGSKKAQALLDKSDCVVMLGVVEDNNGSISCNIEETRIGKHFYKEIQFIDLCKALLKQDIKKFEEPDYVKHITEFEASDVKISPERFVQKLGSFLTKEMTLVSDTEATKLISNVFVKHQNQFIAPAFYASSGFAIPGGLGVYLAKSSRPVIVTTVNSCKNSWSELSSNKFNPIIFIIKDKTSNWDFFNAELTRNLSIEVSTEKELDAACTKALSTKDAFVILVN
jgi:TPP-dependent 2-oxoacid decarboxylase